MSVTGRCRFVVGTLDGKRVSYIVDDPEPPHTSTSYKSRPLTSGNTDSVTHSRGFRPSTSALSVQQDDTDAKIDGSVVLNNQQLDELLDILHHVGEQQQNRQAWLEDEASLNEQYVKECQSAVHEKPTRDYDRESRDSGYFGTGVMKPSLLEIKKQQWAREKAEMQGLLSPWGAAESEVGTSSYQAAYSQKQENGSGTNSAIPTISYQDQKHNFDSNYPSDMSFNHTPDSRISRSPANHEGRPTKINGSADEGRMKWGDRGVTVGHLWEPSESPSRLPEPKSTSPAWLEKTLGSVGDAEDQNVIYGRKVHIEPAELEEREKRRRKALENQQAIRQQLEERERLRKEERERRIREEKLEEERIRKESQIIEERYKKERQREQKNAEEEDDELIQNQNVGGRRNNKQRSGWSNKDLSPRARNRQRRESESQSQLYKKNAKYASNEPEILTLNHPPEDGKNFSMHDDYKRLHQDYSSRPVDLQGAGDDEMILLGKEVAVLLAPELERRILMSRSGRDVAVQTDLSIFTRRQKSMQQPQPLMSHTKPIWGANRTNKKYVKQSDKDVYRQRGSSLNSRQNKATTDSADDSDKYPRSSSPQLDRRKRAQSLGKSNSNNRRSSEEDVSNLRSRNPRKDTRNENRQNAPAPISWSVDVRENNHSARASPQRITNSPPVPALQTINKYKTMEVERRMSPSPTPNQNFACPPSPPVPAVLRQLQEQTLPPLVYANNEVKTLKSAPPVLKSFPLQSSDDEKIALPEIKQHLLNLPSESSDLLSQLSTIRKTLQSKHSEWQALADEA